jgi:mRNA-degrading endonuclease toxin of MazEF toxin-antitoxin module
MDDYHPVRHRPARQRAHLAKARLVKYLGALDAATMGAVGRRLVLALGLEDCLL